jgi:hypothetical protein
MKIAVTFHSALLVTLLCAPTACLGQFAQGQAFSGSMPLAGMEGAASASSAPDSSLYAEGTRAINEGRWADAVKLFTQAVSLKSDHADAALYWKAYAENRQGQTKPALDTCQQLRSDFPKSRWMEECGALEIEIHAKIGKPVQPKAGQSDELKLLALNFLLQKDETRALAEIQDILNSDASQKLKDGALFLMGQHHSDETYPQIVRLSYVEGDVRIARGKEAEKTTGAVWEKAVAGLPLETGFNLVTGAGRAEIEFENASVLYLGENSVLSLNDLHSTAGVPYTELALLSGTVSLDIHPFVAGEDFVLRTPTDNYVTKYPGQARSRITSYVDGIAITPLESGTLKLPGSTQAMVNGQTAFYRGGERIDPVGPNDPGAFTAWDKWVANRVAERTTAMAEVMKASGLTTPIPGMADLKGQGRFFDCPPYGTCWEPAAGNEQEQPRGVTLAASQPLAAITSSKSTPSVRSSSGPSGASMQVIDREADFPCTPSAIRYQSVRDLNTGKDRVIDYSLMANPYDWALCHAGSWIHHRHHYVWVAGHRRHHLAPVRWVRSGRSVAFVPLHPYDVKGRPPVNRKEEVFAVNKKDGLSVERVKFNADRPIEFLKSPPKEFRADFAPPLPRAEEPRIEAHMMKDGMGAKSALAQGGGGIPLSFDHKTQTFGMAGISERGNSGRQTFAPINNHGGNLQSHGSGGGVSSSGGSHGGGGSSSGGGGSHSSGGGSSSSSSTSGSSSSSAPSSSSSSSSAGSSAHH